jgi:hypothetical protein
MAKGGDGTRKGADRTSAAERRLQRKKHRSNRASAAAVGSTTNGLVDTDNDTHIVDLLSKNEDELLNFVAMVNRVYQEKLHKPAPFMTFVLLGIQSAGKSAIVERFMNAVLNIVQEGTGTRCPLDITCIHDASCAEAKCELYGEELPKSDCGQDLTGEQVFKRIVKHNQMLSNEDRFSTKPIRLVYRATTVQNMRFVDTPGIIANQSTVRWR